jgi:hypothetical protein
MNCMSRTRQTIGLVVILAVCLGAAAVNFSIRQMNREPRPMAGGGSRTTAAASPLHKAGPGNAASKDDRLRKLLVGTWQDEYQGKRTLTLREDGTGTMVVELKGLKATLVAPRLTFNMRWSLAEGRLRKRSLDGEPAAQVNMILKTMGDTADETILELSEDRLRLLDQDGRTEYDWRRVRR